jgi:hypothetical protein
MVVLLRHLADAPPANTGVVISHAVAPSRPTQRASAGRIFFIEVVSSILVVAAAILVVAAAAAELLVNASVG